MKGIILGLIVTVATACTTQAQEVALQYKFKTGEEFEYVQASKQNAIQTLPGMGETKMEGSLGGTMILKIKSIDGDGSARIAAQYSKLKMVTTSFIMSMSLDSDGLQEEDGNKIMKSLTGKTFFFTLTKSGKVENVEGVENLYSGLGALNLEEGVINNTRKALQQTINDKSIKTLLENGLITYPEKAVKHGEQWNTSAIQAVNFPMKIENKWTLASVEGSTAKITGSGELTTIDKEKINNLVNGMKSKSDLTGTQAVDGKVDVQTGWPKEVKIISNLKGKMTLLQGGMIPMDMEIPVTVKIETDYSIVKKK